MGMRYGLRSLNFLLEEKKLWECGLLGETEYTDDSNYMKYSKWDDVPVPRSYVDPTVGPLEFQSPNPASLINRTFAEQEGMDHCTMSLWSPTPLRTKPSQLVHFPRCSDHRPNVDLLVHRNGSKLRSFEIRYSTDEHWN